MIENLFWIALGFSLAINLLVIYLLLRLRRFQNAVNRAILSALSNAVAAQEELLRINQVQQEMNQIVNNNFEILGVHTKLIKPTIGMQAEMFLDWYNKKKEEKNESE